MLVMKGRLKILTVLLFLSLIIFISGCLDSDLELNVNVSGQGAVSPSEGTHNFESGDTVEFTVEPDEGWILSEYSGDCSGSDCELVMDEDKMVSVHFERPSKGLFYEVENDKNDVYILGSTHYGDEEMYPLREEIYETIEEADVLAFEIDLERPEFEMVQILNDRGTYGFGEELSDHISEDTFEEVYDILIDYGIHMNALENFKPWFVAMVVEDTALRRAGYDPDHGIEDHVMDSATTDEDIVGLESVEQQVDVLDNLSMETQKAYLEEAIEEYEKSVEYAKEIIDEWKAGNTEFFVEERHDFLDQEVEEGVELYEGFLKTRDRKMTEEIIDYLETDNDKTYLVSVGSLHVVGDDSIVDNLRSEGYEVNTVYS